MIEQQAADPGSPRELWLWSGALPWAGHSGELPLAAPESSGSDSVPLELSCSQAKAQQGLSRPSRGSGLVPCWCCWQQLLLHLPGLCHRRVPIAPCLGPPREGAASHGDRGGGKQLPASQLRRS